MRFTKAEKKANLQEAVAVRHRIEKHASITLHSIYHWKLRFSNGLVREFYPSTISLFSEDGPINGTLMRFPDYPTLLEHLETVSAMPAEDDFDVIEDFD